MLNELVWSFNISWKEKRLDLYQKMIVFLQNDALGLWLPLKKNKKLGFELIT